MASNSVKNDTGKMQNRMLIGTATRGMVRMEWAIARYNQVTPCNWSLVQTNKAVNDFSPIGFLVADAQNLIVRDAIMGEYEWLFLLEDDNIIPPDCFIKLNGYMHKDVPVVSGLYFTKSEPAEPIIYRGRGNSYYDKWKLGDKVWCDGVPTGCLLISGKLLKAMWDESPEYNVSGTITRRVFDQPEKAWYDPEINGYRSLSGTSDLTWCERVINEGFLKKAGYNKYAKMEYPLLCDTSMLIKHIDNEGKVYPQNFTWPDGTRS